MRQLLLLTGMCVLWMNAAFTQLKKLVLQNSLVKCEVYQLEGKPGVERKFYAKDRSGKWKLMLQGFMPVYSPKDTVLRLWDMSLNPSRFLETAIPVSSGEIVAGKNGGTGVIQLNMKHNHVEITETISLKPAAGCFHIAVTAAFPQLEPQLDYLLSSYEIVDKELPDFFHSPGVKFDDKRSGPATQQVFGDRTFAAPAVMFGQKENFIALVPDLDTINRRKVLSPDARRKYLIAVNGPFNIPFKNEVFSMPTALDCNFKTGLSDYPVITYGLMDAAIGYHTKFIRNETNKSMVRTLLGNSATYAFDIMVNANETGTGYQQVAQYQWKRYGHPAFVEKPQLAMPFEEYVKLVTTTINNPIRNAKGELVQIPGGILDAPVSGYDDHGSWLQWEEKGIKMGGYRCSAPFWNDVINNSPFWNQARDAVGMYYWGKTMHNDTLVDRARRIINFCLSAPRNHYGLFSTVYSASTRQWGPGWTDPPHGKDVLFLRDGQCYEMTSLCKTAAHLLDYFLRSERDPRITTYLTPFANWLLSVIDDRGIVPSYVTVDMQSSPVLYESAQPAAAMWMLAEMYLATKEVKYLAGAKRIAKYIEKEVIPGARWIDAEQYISCGAKPYSWLQDEWQHQWFRGTLCTIWACEGFAALHQATSEYRWINNAALCADYLSFSQCVWKPHFIYTADPFGGLGTDNSDNAVFLDQRQAELAKPFIYIGKITGRADLIERGVAAARAACVLIVHPRHVSNGIFPYARFYPEGLAPENIDHEGSPQCPMRTHPLWGEGLAVYTGLAEVYRALGGLYINPAKKMAIPVDGIELNAVAFSANQVAIALESSFSVGHLVHPWNETYEVKVIIDASANTLVNINGMRIKNTGKLVINK